MMIATEVLSLERGFRSLDSSERIFERAGGPPAKFALLVDDAPVAALLSVAPVVPLGARAGHFPRRLGGDLCPRALQQRLDQLVKVNRMALALVLTLALARRGIVAALARTRAVGA